MKKKNDKNEKSSIAESPVSTKYSCFQFTMKRCRKIEDNVLSALISPQLTSKIVRNEVK